MSIRIRSTIEGYVVALCAARSVEVPGDLYLDDAVHEALTRKFVRDFDSMGFLNYTPSSDASDALVDREESNNPNRTEWDKTFGASTDARG